MKKSITVASHRRSGTHIVISSIQHLWKHCEIIKTHAWPENHPKSDETETIYIYRNPFDVLWSSWNWWTDIRLCGNAKIAEMMLDVTFDDFILGKVGHISDFESFSMPQKDDLAHQRGLFYNPVMWWKRHVQEWSMFSEYVISYENLISSGKGKEQIADVISTCRGNSVKSGQVKIPSNLVGHSHKTHKIQKPGYSMEFYDSELTEFIINCVGPQFLSSLGYQNLTIGAF